MISLPRTPSFSLAGKRALVTGATSGIGLSCATALAEAGAEVTLAARSAGTIAEVAAACEERGLTARELPLDVADVAATMDAVAMDGPYDVLVNSAGVARHGPSLEMDLGRFDEVANLNIRGAYFLTVAVAKGLHKAGKPGSLINVSSQMGHVGGPDRTVYCATKHAVEGFTKAMAIEWGPLGIRVNTICPTFVRTPLTAPTFDDPERSRWLIEKIKLGRVGEVEDMMGAVVYLASDASALVTGTALMIDGGWTAE
ncbi:MAG: SDR family oxidoreductase [Pseudomonadota bacterium]